MIKLIPKHLNKSPIRKINFDINSYTNDKLGLNGGQKTSTIGTTQLRNQQLQAARLTTVHQTNLKAAKIHNYADQTRRLNRTTASETIDPKTGETGVSYLTSLAPVEAPMQIVSPEFDALMMFSKPALTAMNETMNVGKALVGKLAPKIKSNITFGNSQSNVNMLNTTGNLNKGISLSSADANNYFNLVKLNIRTFYNSPLYRLRLVNAGKSEEEINKTISQLNNNIDNSTFSYRGISESGNGSGTMAGGTGINKNGGYSIIMDPKYAESPETFMSNLEHEFHHAASGITDGTVNGQASTVMSKNILPENWENSVDLLASNMDYNTTLLDGKAITPLAKATKMAENMDPNKSIMFPGSVKIRGLNTPDTNYGIRGSWILNKAKYMLLPLEIRARMMTLNTTAQRKGLSLIDYLRSNPINDNLYLDLREYFTPLQIYNYSSKALGYTAPVGFGYSTLNNLK